MASSEVGFKSPILSIKSGNLTNGALNAFAIPGFLAYKSRILSVVSSSPTTANAGTTFNVWVASIAAPGVPGVTVNIASNNALDGTPVIITYTS